MALRRFSLPIIFALLLLFAQVLARDLEEKPAADKKDTAGKDSDAEVDGYGFGYGGPYGHGPYGRGPYGHYPRRCRFYCGYGCCSEEEFAAYSQGAELDQVSQVDDEKHYGYGYGYGRGPRYGYGRRPGFGYRPPRCRYYCGSHCCSAEEHAEFVQDQN